MQKLIIILLLTGLAYGKDRVYVPYGVINGKINVREIKRVKKKIKIVRYCDSFEFQFPYFYSCLSESSDCLDLFYKRIERNGYSSKKRHFLLLNSVEGGEIRGNIGYGNIEVLNSYLASWVWR